MLAELTIRDFAIIDELRLSLSPHFNVLTGETGAGKSIIIDAVSLLLGGRAEAVMVRTGAERALTEGVFHLDGSLREAIAPLLAEHGLEDDEPSVLSLAREVRGNGRAVCRVNGRSVALSILKEIAQNLVDIHGQSEHLSLLRVREHVNLLDRYAGLWEQREQFAGWVGQLRALQSELGALERDERQLAQRADLLKFQVEEIEAARLRPGEDLELEAEQLRLANAEHLAQLAEEAYSLLYEGSAEAPSVLDGLAQVNRGLTGLAKIDPALSELAKSVEESGYVLDDAARSVRDYREKIEFNPRRLEYVEERLALVKRLKRKYGASIEDVNAFAGQAAAELDQITHRDERIESLRTRERELLDEIGQRGQALSEARRAAAIQLAKQIELELNDLHMAGARLGVSIEWEADESGARASHPSTQEAGRYVFDASGLDRVEFLIAPNVGEGLKPLSKVASGGETSRLMLALKTVLSRADRTPTLIFDEIDQGIGGRVGAIVGRKLWGLTQAGRQGINHQVICITHLPQLAAYGEAHFKVEKSVAGERTSTRVSRLKEKARVEELAQMLGASGEGALRSAQEILAAVQADKKAKP
ncbi:MAG: DNA repair protein RecN [Thermoflexales bacterium]|nr:DNA repair protein RecN [Thermoflexales bacterium]